VQQKQRSELQTRHEKEYAARNHRKKQKKTATRSHLPNAPAPIEAERSRPKLPELRGDATLRERSTRKQHDEA
jgi:hypothetical protein